ncbi:oligo-1,6-glucosidase [Aeromicrobium ponti]|uniref:oligo-1,6-glucosidase n=1 Tax=Cytobacillus oceanisediminis TaxID=665099 RepID=A0A562J6Z2_9BACI|nr:alpha-glucosidase [Cytobacillus oceanisediminis]TWH78897.1 oligo-1,6-glucosidase [Cytobacillus oceanisediminis]
MKKTWWKEAVVYQVYWRSFYDSNGDGIGDLEGLLSKLNYIKELGADVIWLNPMYESPDKDNGYDISDYYKVMEKAGDMQTVERLVSEVHKLGMKIIMDLVVNHTSDQHPWFLESRSSKDNPKRDWYIWKDAKDEKEPNNWRSYFTPSPWEWDVKTGQYYFHSFASEQPDLNWENLEVREEIYRIMRFWLDKGIDGFRMDVINLLAKEKGYKDAEDPYDLSYLGNNPGIHEYLQEMNREVLRYYDIMTVGEIPFVTPEDGLLYVGENRNELHTLFHFQVADDMRVWDMLRYKEIQKLWYEGLKGKGWNSQFLNNHDHTRQVTRYGNDGKYRAESAKLLATLVHTLPGTPYIFQGEEIGMTGVCFEDIEDYQDIAMKNKYREQVGLGEAPDKVLRDLQPLSRDNSRTPVQWDVSENAGFTKGVPWIKVNPNYTVINVKEELKNPDSVLHYYKKLIALRKENEVMVYGDYDDLSEGNLELYIYTRTLDEVTWLIVLNHSENINKVNWPEKLGVRDKELLLWNYSSMANDESDSKMILRPFESRIYQIAR